MIGDRPVLCPGCFSFLILCLLYGLYKFRITAVCGKLLECIISILSEQASTSTWVSRNDGLYTNLTVAQNSTALRCTH